jgi:hypothetical protein
MLYVSLILFLIKLHSLPDELPFIPVYVDSEGSGVDYFTVLAEVSAVDVINFSFLTDHHVEGFLDTHFSLALGSPVILYEVFVNTSWLILQLLFFLLNHQFLLGKAPVFLKLR